MAETAKKILPIGSWGAKPLVQSKVSEVITNNPVGTLLFLQETDTAGVYEFVLSINGTQYAAAAVDGKLTFAAK